MSSNGDDLRAQIAAMQEKLKKQREGTHAGVYNAVTKACKLVEAEAKREMTEAEIDASKSYGKQQHHPSVPGSAPAVDFGTLRQSITHSVDQEESGAVGRVGSVITDPPYGQFLEYGTSKMASRPWLRPAIEKCKPKIKELLSEGAKGRDVSMGVEGATAGMGVSDAAD